MKKIFCSLLCAVLFSSVVRADVESQLDTIEQKLGQLIYLLNENNALLPSFAGWLSQQEFATVPLLGPYEEWLTSQFQDYVYYPITSLLLNMDSSLFSMDHNVWEINDKLLYLPTHLNEHLDGMNYQGFNVRVVEQDNTDIKTYLENAVSTPLDHIYTMLQNGLNVHGTVSADFNFDYSRFNDVFSYYASATGPSRFNLAYHKRYVWASPFYDPKKPIPDVVSEQVHGGSSYDFLGFIEQYCNGSLQNMEQLQAGLVQVVGALRGDDAKTEEITDEFESVEDDVAGQLSELRNTIDFSKYNLEVSDELFRYEVFAIGDGSLQMPEFVNIGPFQLDMFGSQTPSLGFTIDCREWRTFFELCRSCFTIIIYLVICTLALSICFLLWKVGAPCVRVLQNIFNF